MNVSIIEVVYGNVDNVFLYYVLCIKREDYLLDDNRTKVMDDDDVRVSKASVGHLAKDNSDLLDYLVYCIINVDVVRIYV